MLMVGMLRWDDASLATPEARRRSAEQAGEASTAMAPSPAATRAVRAPKTSGATPASMPERAGASNTADASQTAPRRRTPTSPRPRTRANGAPAPAPTLDAPAASLAADGAIVEAAPEIPTPAQRGGISPENTVFVSLCFEGPDVYSTAGGLGTRVTEFPEAAAAAGHQTHP